MAENAFEHMREKANRIVLYIDEARLRLAAPIVTNQALAWPTIAHSLDRDRTIPEAHAPTALPRALRPLRPGAEFAIYVEVHLVPGDDREARCRTLNAGASRDPKPTAVDSVLRCRQTLSGMLQHADLACSLWRHCEEHVLFMALVTVPQHHFLVAGVI